MTELATHNQEPTADERFVSVGTPIQMDRSQLQTCADPDGTAGHGEVPVFAVAYIDGVVQTPALQREWEAVNVLYLTADGTQAVERWYKRCTPDDLADVDRACIVPTDEVEPVGEGARRFASALAHHPERH